MTAPEPHLDRTADDPRAGWDAVASGWAEWWDTIERGARPVSERLIDLAGLAPGQRVLDVATGLGEPAATAARRIAPNGRVLATDFAPAMLEQARARARRLGLDNIDFRIMDAADPDLPSAAFDAVLCRWGLMFVPEPARSLAALHRALKPGGRLAIAVWGPPEAVPAIDLPNRIVAGRLDLPAPPDGTPSPFSLCDADALRRTLRAAGYDALTSEPVSVVFRFDSVEAFIRFRREVSSVEARTADCPPARREAAWRAVGQSVERFVTEDGALAIPNLALCVSGRRQAYRR